MRFLQTEWHRHERDRNAWEIEREEMRNRIAILEGETRTSKGMRISLERHVKLLEAALKKAREKSRNVNKGEIGDSHKDARELAREELKAAGKGTTARGCVDHKLLTRPRPAGQSYQPFRRRNQSREPLDPRNPSGKGTRQVQRLPLQMLIRNHLPCPTDNPCTAGDH